MDLTGKFLSASREVRIVTNLCVYWDEIFLIEVRRSRRKCAMTGARRRSAPSLRFRGFSQAMIHPERKQPETFDYAQVAPASRCGIRRPGLYTRYGDVKASGRRRWTTGW